VDERVELRAEGVARRSGARRPIAAAATALIILASAAAAGAYLGGRGSTAGSAAAPNAPPWRAGVTACRRNPMAHVHDPSSLVVLARCSTVSGTVKKVLEYNPLDGDRELFVAVDQPYERFLRPSNQGLLPVEVIPTDAPSIPLPAIGDHATFYGAWVLDRNRDDSAEIHPAWRIDISARLAASGLPDAARTGRRAASGQTLSLQVAAPPSVKLGAGMNVVVVARSGAHGRQRPASQVHLFLEVTSRQGAGVRWAAASTNTLGVARVYLIALNVPGRFTLWVYAEKDRQSAVATVPFRVKRR
jgi:hypothetical protein